MLDAIPTHYLVVLEILWVSLVVLWLVYERRSPTATLAWIFALIFLPLVGSLVYFFFGPRRMRKRKLAHAHARSVTSLARAADENDEVLATKKDLALATLAERTAGLPPMRCERVDVLIDGDQTFDAMLEAIREARDHVHIEYYIFAEGKTASALVSALVERASAGVEVRVLIDHLGSYGSSRRLFAPLVAAGGRFTRFGHTAASHFRLRFANFRTHRKILVVDGKVGFTGGLNIDDVHDARLVGRSAWRDTHVRITGDAVRGLQATFAQNWRYATTENLKGARYFPAPTRRGEHVAQIVSGGPDNVFAMHRLFHAMLASAESRILLTTPYFLPDDAIRDTLVVAALRGVEVKVLLPVACDSSLVDAAMRTYYDELVPMGIEIHEYEPRMLHAKTLVVDDALALIGTANIDNRSLRLNFEVVATFYDAHVAAVLAAHFEEDLTHARRITARELAAKPLPRRLWEGFARLFSPLL